MSDSTKIRPSSGNVFADLGIRNPDEYLMKSKLAAGIQYAIESKGLTQERAGAILGISQPKVSALLKGCLDGFSTDRLLRFLIRLGSDIKIHVSKPHAQKAGRVFVDTTLPLPKAKVNKPKVGTYSMSRSSQAYGGQAKVSVTKAKGARRKPVGSTSS